MSQITFFFHLVELTLQYHLHVCFFHERAHDWDGVFLALSIFPENWELRGRTVRVILEP